MRTLSLLLLVALASPAVSAGPYLHRATAEEVLRTRVKRIVRSVEPNLRADADVETLTRPVTLAASRTGKIVVDGATSVRLQISGAAEGTVLWIAGEDDMEMERVEVTASTSWSPTVRGSIVYIQSESPVSVTKLAAGFEQTTNASCLQDAACSAPQTMPEIDEAARAIALIRFVRGNASYVCTGGLINDAAESRTPYFLTAHHCISTQEEADSIEAVWDERSAACGLAPKSTRTYGGELLVSSAATDVALLRLRKLPPNRVFLTVERSPLPAGTFTYRLSHGNGAPLQYSAGEARTEGGSCPSAPRSRFIYTTQTAGAVASGSSGAPLLLPGLRVAGQLLGLCGPSPSDSCAIYNDTVNGSIVASWELLAPYLDPVSSRRRAVR